jgi:mannose-6-phosphate isomerase-like protein (cupin superfamily)
VRIKALPFVLFVVCSVSGKPSEPEGFGIWKGSLVANAPRELAPKIDDDKFAWLPMGTYSNHYFGVSHREGNGGAELHQTQVDIWIVEDGEATLVLGGRIVDPKTVKPNEIRGTSIEGGQTYQVAKGDVVHIPINVAHELRIPSGKTFTYLVIKIDSK